MKKAIKILLWIILAVVVLFGGLVLSKWLANTNTNKFEQKTQSEHFKLYYNSSDEEAIPDIEAYLEDNYERLTTDLKQKLDYKVEIKIYPDLKSFHKAVKANSSFFWWTVNVPDWVVGTANGNTIRMVSPLADSGRTYEDILKVAVHEFTHAVASQINSSNNRSFILSEGIAVYEAGQNISVEELSEKCTVDDLPKSIEEMFSWDENESSKLYAFGGLFTGFIVENYGYDKFIELYQRDYTNNVFDDDIREIYENWIFQMKTFCLA